MRVILTSAVDDTIPCGGHNQTITETYSKLDLPRLRSTDSFGASRTPAVVIEAALAPLCRIPSGAMSQNLNTVHLDVRLPNDAVELKNMDALRVAELAIEIQIERMRVTEAMNARDAVAQRLADAHVTINQKDMIIEGLKNERKTCDSDSQTGVTSTSRMTPSLEKGNAKSVEDVILPDSNVNAKSPMEDLKIECTKFANSPGFKTSNDPPPDYEETRTPSRQENLDDDKRVVQCPKSTTLQKPDTTTSAETPKIEDNDLCGLGYKNPLAFQEPEDIAKARLSLLAGLPLPSEIPEDSLKPIVIPSPFTLHEFLGTASGSVRASLVASELTRMFLQTIYKLSSRLSNYRVFQQLTTSWCPDREEHGYLLTPAFKCSTNPRVTTAHRWSAVDVLARMTKPIECFYNKDGKWYYAGVYKAFRLQDLTTKEWEALSTETTQAIIKDTISGRKNTSPQNVYETGQLYAAGALKVACIGLQCVGFNNAMYRAILELASKCTQNGKWRPSSGGLGTGGAWNTVANTSPDNIGITVVTSDGSENTQGELGTKLNKRDSGWPDLVG